MVGRKDLSFDIGVVVRVVAVVVQDNAVPLVRSDHVPVSHHLFFLFLVSVSNVGRIVVNTSNHSLILVLREGDPLEHVLSLEEEVFLEVRGGIVDFGGEIGNSLFGYGDFVKFKDIAIGDFEVAHELLRNDDKRLIYVDDSGGSHVKSNGLSDGSISNLHHLHGVPVDHVVFFNSVSSSNRLDIDSSEAVLSNINVNERISDGGQRLMDSDFLEFSEGIVVGVDFDDRRNSEFRENDHEDVKMFGS